MTTLNYSIDVLKFVCAVLVVLLRAEWKYQWIILPFTRCAVPCFFIISGYLLYDERGIKPDRLKRNTAHVAKITLWPALLFVLWKEGIIIFHNGSLYIPSAIGILKWITFNVCPFGFHLWYLFAYLYVLYIITLVNRYNQWKMMYWLVPLLLLTDLFLGKHSLLLFGWELPVYCVRNLLFVGLPYFAIGTMIKDNQERKASIFRNKRNLVMIVGAFLIFVITTYLERYTLICLGKCAERDYYLSCTFMAICMFLLALSIKSKKNSWASKLGEKDTLYLYILHPIFFAILPILFRNACLYETYLYVAPILVFILTDLFIKTLRRLSVFE